MALFGLDAFGAEPFGAGEGAAVDVAGPGWLPGVKHPIVGELVHVVGSGTHLNGALFHTGLDTPKVAGPGWLVPTKVFTGPIVRVQAWTLRTPVSPPKTPIPVTLGTMVVAGQIVFTPSSALFHRPHLIDFARRFAEGRGLYRVFNAAGYEFFFTTGSPPLESDTPDETNATLPFTTVSTFGDGAHFFSVKFQNGVLNSGFLPLGPNGETFLRLDISGGASIGSPPIAPQDVRLELAAGGVVRIFALYFEAGANRANEWAIAFTTDGSPPPADTPDFTQAFQGTSGLEVLEFNLPAQVDSTLVRVRVQVQRTADSSFSEGSSVLDATADAVGPSAPDAAESWPGSLPEEV